MLRSLPFLIFLAALCFIALVSSPFTIGPGLTAMAHAADIYWMAHPLVVWYGGCALTFTYGSLIVAFRALPAERTVQWSDGTHWALKLAALLGAACISIIPIYSPEVADLVTAQLEAGGAPAWWVSLLTWAELFFMLAPVTAAVVYICVKVIDFLQEID